MSGELDTYQDMEDEGLWGKKKPKSPIPQLQVVQHEGRKTIMLTDTEPMTEAGALRLAYALVGAVAEGRAGILGERLHGAQETIESVGEALLKLGWSE